MKKGSAEFESIVSSINGVRYYQKIIDLTLETELQDIDNFNYSGMINDDNGISIGNTCANQITFEIKNPTVEISGHELDVYQGVKLSSGDIEYLHIGIFKVLKPEIDKGLAKYQAIDRMVYLFENNFTSAYTKATDVQIIKEICSQVGILLENENQLTPHTLDKIPQGYTRREVLGYMAQMQGKNATINSDGNLELKWYENNSYTVDDSRIYFDGTQSLSDDANFVVGFISCEITEYNSDGVAETKTIKAGDGNTGIYIENPFMTQSVLNEVFSKIKDFAYRIATYEFLGDFRLELGDIITISTYGNTYTVPIMQLEQKSDGGVRTTVTSVGQSESENQINLQTPYTKAMQRYYAELVTINKALINKLNVDDLSAKVAEIDNLTATDALISNLKTTLLTADNISATVAKISNLTANDAIIKNIYSNSIVSDEGVINVLQSNLITADLIQAITLDVEKAIVGELDVKYAKIDLANVTTEAVEKLFVNVGILENATITEGKITGTLSGVRVVADVIEANTIVAGDLIVKASDESETYYKINVSESGATEEELKACEYDKYVSGQDIVAKTITATQIASNSITASEIMANSITANELNITTLSSITANLGTVTAGTIQSDNYVANTSGMKLTLSNGVWDSKYFKIANDGKITASGGKIGSTDIKGNYLETLIDLGVTQYNGWDITYISSYYPYKEARISNAFYYRDGVFSKFTIGEDGKSMKLGVGGYNKDNEFVYNYYSLFDGLAFSCIKEGKESRVLQLLDEGIQTPKLYTNNINCPGDIYAKNFYGSVSASTISAVSISATSISESGTALSSKYSPKAGSSSLTTCSKGTFGNAATYGVTTSVTSGSTALITSGAVYSSLINTSAKGATRTAYAVYRSDTQVDLYKSASGSHETWYMKIIACPTTINDWFTLVDAYQLTTTQTAVTLTAGRKFSSYKYIFFFVYSNTGTVLGTSMTLTNFWGGAHKTHRISWIDIT